MLLEPVIKENIKNVVFKEYGLEDFFFVVEHPDNETFGDYASNVAMVISKLVKQPPFEIAKNLSYKLKELGMKYKDASEECPLFSDIDAVVPGFINFKISTNWLKYVLGTVYSDPKDYGVTNSGSKKRIALEHSNVNPNKAAHVGHLRNACVGQFLEKVYETLGYEAEVQYYANNVGVQVATSMMGMQHVKDFNVDDYEKFDHFAWDVYAAMESRINESKELQEERSKILMKLENPLSEESIKQRELANKILIEQLKTFQKLGFDYDVIIYESDILALKLWEKAFEELKKNPNVYLATEGISKGCWLVKLGETSLANSESNSNETTEITEIEKDKIIVRSNGVATYTGKDIAYHMWKFGLLDTDFSYEQWDTGTQSKLLWVTRSIESSGSQSQKSDVTFSNVDYVFDVIGVEQSYAIETVRQSLEYLGFEENAKNMVHVNYGFVFLSKNTAEKLGIDTSDGRKFYAMSGRKGRGIKIDDLISMVDAKLKDTYGEFDHLSIVRNGAIKLQMLKLNTFQDLIFDLDEALDLKGYSGPYLQYACVRANAVLNKYEGDIDTLLKSDLPERHEELEDKELALLRWIYRYPEIVEKSAKEYAPNVLSDYLFETAKRFNSFYNDVVILAANTEEERAFRLKLTFCVKTILENGLDILGIEVPSRM